MSIGITMGIKISTMQNKFFYYLLYAAYIFQIIGAVPSGLSMIIDPSGDGIGIPLTVLEPSPFDSFLIPGLFLFFMLGIFPIVILYGLIRKPELMITQAINPYKDYHWSWYFSHLFGLLLILWINMQLFFIQGFHIYHFIVTMVGVLIVFITHLPSIRCRYKVG